MPTEYGNPTRTSAPIGPLDSFIFSFLCSIKNAFRVWKTARIEACTTIQRLYRAYKEAAPLMDLKLSNEAHIQVIFKWICSYTSYSLENFLWLFEAFLIVGDFPVVKSFKGKFLFQYFLIKFSEKINFIDSPNRCRAGKSDTGIPLQVSGNSSVITWTWKIRENFWMRWVQQVFLVSSLCIQRFLKLRSQYFSAQNAKLSFILAYLVVPN